MSEEKMSVGRKMWAGLRDLFQTGLMMLVFYTLVNLLIPRYAVEGSSMQPTFDGHNHERVMVNRLGYLVDDLERGDIVVLNNPDGTDQYIKRVIGLPGENVRMENGQVYINGVLLHEPYITEACALSRCDNQTWTLNEVEYFVLGDNRNASVDSTTFGPIHRSLIIGTVWLRYWPLDSFDIFSHQEYE